MIPVHASRETTPYERGHALGVRWRAAVARTCQSYVDLFAANGVSSAREWGLRALAETHAWAPDLGAEIEGVAAGASLEPWLLGALNGRTEILAAAAAECSTAVSLGAGPPRTIQTWDWHDTLRHVMLLRDIAVGDRRVCTLTEFGIVGKIGVNSAGLGVHFNVLRHASDSTDIGVPVHVVSRRVLDEATTVAEAVAIAKSARLSASSVLTVVTADEASCVELSPAGVVEVAPADGFLCHTNHFLAPSLAPGERTVPEESTTAARFAALHAAAGDLSSADRDERAAALRPVCVHADPALPPHQRWESLATVSIDVAAARLDVHEGGPCRVSPDTWQSLTAKEQP